MPEPTEPSPTPSPASIADWGLSSAAAVVERMLELGRAGTSGLRLTFPANGEAPGADAPGAPGSSDPEADAADRARQARRFRADAERLVELYADWTRMLVDGAASLAEQAVGGGSGGSAGDAARAEVGVLVLGPASAGATTTATAWLHVLDGPAAAPARLHASPLVAHDGSAVGGDALSCSPDRLDTSAARTSAEIRVTVVVPSGTAVGAYHGHLLAEGLPEVVLPVRLDVVA